MGLWVVVAVVVAVGGGGSGGSYVHNKLIKEAYKHILFVDKYKKEKINDKRYIRLHTHNYVDIYIYIYIYIIYMHI